MYELPSDESSSDDDQNVQLASDHVSPQGEVEPVVALHLFSVMNRLLCFREGMKMGMIYVLTKSMLHGLIYTIPGFLLSTSDGIISEESL